MLADVFNRNITAAANIGHQDNGISYCPRKITVSVDAYFYADGFRIAPAAGCTAKPRVLRGFVFR
jgi:hypothetical protein